jgi:uncharacterized membrane protein
MRQRIALIVLVGLLVSLGVLIFVATGALPVRVATHFGIDGLPNRWVSRDRFAAFATLLALAPVIVLQGINFLIGRLPPSLINIPNRDYWLAEKRRDKTIRRIRVAVLEFGNAMLAFLIFVTWSIIDANRAAPDVRLGSTFVYGLFAFLGFAALWVFFLVRPYLRIPDDASGASRC